MQFLSGVWAGVLGANSPFLHGLVAGVPALVLGLVIAGPLPAQFVMVSWFLAPSAALLAAAIMRFLRREWDRPTGLVAVEGGVPGIPDHIAEGFQVVLARGFDDRRGMFESVLDRSAQLVGFAGHELVGAEVVLEALDQHRRQLRDVLDVVPDVVALEHRDDLVVRLAAIEQLECRR